MLDRKLEQLVAKAIQIRPLTECGLSGVASSGGAKTPGTVSETARDALAFCDALGLKKINAVGSSLGGMIAQQMALDHSDRVGRFVLLGTGPRGGEGMTFTELSAETRADPVQFLLAAFFSPSDASQAAGRAYLDRRRGTRDRDRPVRVSQVHSTSAFARLGSFEAERSGFKPEMPLARHTGLAIRAFSATQPSPPQRRSGRSTRPRGRGHILRAGREVSDVGVPARPSTDYERRPRNRVGRGDYNPKID